MNAKLRAAAAASRAGDGDPDIEAAHRAASARATLIQSGAFQILNGAHWSCFRSRFRSIPTFTTT